jgi:cysteine-rich repeat protein
MRVQPASIVAAAVALAIVAIAPVIAPAATITIVNHDDPGVGLNDPTPRAPVGGNTATTLGTQRRAALQFAADVWGAYLASPVEIRVGVTFEPLTCDGLSGVLGSARADAVYFGFVGAAPNTVYPSALADKVAGMDLDAAADDVVARFNVLLGAGGDCDLDFYLGFDGNPPSSPFIDLVSVALHELGHGLGFSPLFSVQTGAEAVGLDDVYELGLEQHGVGPLATMTNAGRAAAAKADGNLHFVGASVTAALGALTGGVSGGHVQMYAPTTLAPGSSVSHFDTDVMPNELMEPSYTGPNHSPGLAFQLLCDIGWGPCGTCGDGSVDPNETCDDGDTDSGDGCSSLCRVEACSACVGEPSVCAPAANDTPCDDGSVCTATDTCQGGVCTGDDPVTCSALDQCHDVGTCDPISGVCSNPAKAEGAFCNDGESCTGPDTCSAGTCSGPPSCIDPFLCYKAKTSSLGASFVSPPTVALADAFENLDVTVRKPSGLCTPAELNADPIADAATHLESYPLKAIKGQAKHVKQTALVKNALGTITVQTQKPSFLLVPTNESAIADPPPVGGIEVDHYKCYAAKVAKATPKFPKGVTISVADPFIVAPQTFAVKKPTHLCAPVDKNGEGIAHDFVYQLCYAVKPTVKNASHPGLFVHTQFGAEVLDATKEERICVPSLATTL